MPRTTVVFYQEDDGTVPLLEWFDAIPTRAQDKCRAKIERLQELGHELRRPEADYLRDGIYELRVGLQGVHYRMLYFFTDLSRRCFRMGSPKNSECPRAKLTWPFGANGHSNGIHRAIPMRQTKHGEATKTNH